MTDADRDGLANLGKVWATQVADYIAAYLITRRGKPAPGTLATIGRLFDEFGDEALKPLLTPEWWSRPAAAQAEDLLMYARRTADRIIAALEGS